MLLSEDNIFTALHAMQKRSSDENSVCSYVKCVHCDKTEERSVPMFIPFEIPFSLVFWEEEWVGGGDPFYPCTWNSGSTGPRWSEIADFQPIFACSTSAVTTSEKSVQNLNNNCDNAETVRDSMSLSLLLITNRKSHLGFRLVATSMTLNYLERCNSAYVAFFHRIRQIFRPIISRWLKIGL